MSDDLRDLLAKDETIVLQTRQHWFVVLTSLVKQLLLLALLAVAIWYFGSAGWLDNTAGDWGTKALWVAVAVLLVVVGWVTLGWVTERFYITTSKIVYVRGILHREITSTPLVKIDEITLCRPLLGRLVGFGRLEVENASGGTEPLQGLEYLPHPVKLYQMISERSRAQRMVEGGAHRDDDGDGLVDYGAPRAAAPAPAPAPPRNDDGGDGRWVPSGDPTTKG